MDFLLAPEHRHSDGSGQGDVWTEPAPWLACCSTGLAVQRMAAPVCVVEEVKTVEGEAEDISHSHPRRGYVLDLEEEALFLDVKNRLRPERFQQEDPGLVGAFFIHGETDFFGADAKGADAAGAEFGGAVGHLVADRDDELVALVDGFAVLLLEGAGDEVHGRGADEAGDEVVGGHVVDFAGRAQLLQGAFVHDRDLVGHGHALNLIMGDVDHGGAQFVLQAFDFGAHVDAQEGVDVGEGLVHEENNGLAHDGAAEGDALLLAAGAEARRPLQRMGDAQHFGHIADAALDLVFWRFTEAQGIGDVVEGGEVGVEGIALEDEGDVAFAGFEVVDARLTDVDIAVGGALQTCYATHGGGLAAAGRAEQDDQVAVSDDEIELIHGAGIAEVLCQTFYSYFRQNQLSFCYQKSTSGQSRRTGVVIVTVPLRSLAAAYWPLATPKVSPRTRNLCKVNAATNTGKTAMVPAALTTPQSSSCCGICAWIAMGSVMVFMEFTK